MTQPPNTTPAPPPAAPVQAVHWRLTLLLLPHLLPARLGWLPRALALVLWLVYAMQIAYGWRLELGYWSSLALVFGWPFLHTVFWSLLIAWALPRLMGPPR